MIFVTGPMAARAELPNSFAASLIILMERLVKKLKEQCRIPIFSISDMISFEKQHF